MNDAQVTLRVAPWAVEVHPPSCRTTRPPGSAEFQVALANVSSSSIAAPFTVVQQANQAIVAPRLRTCQVP